MGENDLGRTFRELEEAVEQLLKGRQGGPEQGRVSQSPVSAKKDPERVEASDGSIDKEAVELIRRAIKRLKSLY